MAESSPSGVLEALRLLRRAAAGSTRGSRLDAGRIGGILLRASPSLVVTASEIEPLTGVAVAVDPPPQVLRIREMVLLGARGTAPRMYTERSIRTRTRAGDPLAAFLDILQQRSVEILGRAHEQYRPALEAERASDQDQFPDGGSALLASLIGLHGPIIEQRLQVPPSLLRAYAAHLALGRATADGLEGVLREILGVDVVVEQFRGRWLPVGAGDQPRLGEQAGECPPAVFPALCGDAIWDVTSSFRVRLGPMGAADFRRFLPDQIPFRMAVEFVRLLAGFQFEFDVQVCLHAAEVPVLTLGSADPAGAGRLGFDTWLGSPADTPWVGDSILPSRAAELLSESMPDQAASGDAR